MGTSNVADLAEMDLMDFMEEDAVVTHIFNSET